MLKKELMHASLRFVFRLLKLKNLQTFSDYHVVKKNYMNKLFKKNFLGGFYKEMFNFCKNLI